VVMFFFFSEVRLSIASDHHRWNYTWVAQNGIVVPLVQMGKLSHFACSPAGSGRSPRRKQTKSSGKWEHTSAGLDSGLESQK